jgi:hypothetical protein
MGKLHVHKRLTSEAAKEILSRYDRGELDLTAARSQLGVRRSRFFDYLKEYRTDSEHFSVAYERSSPKRLSEKTEELIKTELLKEQALITNPALPLKHYNYAAVHDVLRDRDATEVSTSTIIRRAKEYGCYREPRVKKIHDREVITNYVGELIQHDSSVHQWSPYVEKKWYAITSLDDYSRALVFADLFEHENRWNHISAVESVVLNYGIPLSYYVDQHSIFRFVERRDSQWKKSILKTDDRDPQWKQVLNECGIQTIYALSPQAKGKIERPYQWMQDRVVRRCAKDHVTTFSDTRAIFREEALRCTTKQVHSTTKEIPIIRMHQTIKEGRTMFRPFRLPHPYELTKDIFCLREQRVVDNYRKISLYSQSITVPGVPPKEVVELRIVPQQETQTVEVRFWFKGVCTGSQTFRQEDLPLVRF